MTEQLEPRYDHRAVEEKIYKLWEESGHFNPDNLPVSKIRNSKLPARRSLGAGGEIRNFSIIMPPPNANGPLHVGHAFEVALQDLMIRFWRMRGRRALWLPGADHAGFETQVVFDKKLEKEGRNRFQIDRETLWKEMWEFTQANKKTMEGQLRRLGASCDWSREKFTLDPEIIKIVYETFAELHKDNLLYRDLRVVNWCTKHKTALSDLEVKYVERADPLYYIKYGPLTLATVRPETKFGDTALAVNPKDRRYQKYIGREIEAKGVLGHLKFKVIADEAVDPKFGTGVVKVTPAHDATDFEIWQRHKNEIPGPKIVIDENGRLTGETGKFAGLKVTEARQKVAEEMRRLGILEKTDPNYVHQIAACYKCGTTLEPIPKMQWFVRMSEKPRQSAKREARSAGKSLRDLGVEAVKSGKIKFYPKRFEKIYLHWLRNIRDWNISRQIVWGIRIPAWFCLNCGDVKINPEIKARWFIVRHGETDWNVEKRTQGHINTPLNKKGREQAESIGNALKNENIDLIISSDLARAKETAEIISKITKAELVIDERLRERGFGKAEGLSREEMLKKYSDVYDYETRTPGGESFKDLEKRAWDSFKEHAKNHGHKNIIIVSHGGTIRMIEKQLRNLSIEQTTRRKVPGNTEALRLDILDRCENCGSHFYEQDLDVFDTWFSSGQWPFATLLTSRGSKLKIKNQKSKIGYTTNDFETFYPTDVMAPGYEILFFWVARMVMLGLYRTGKIPFRTVYLHGIVRDKDRQKMSKSRGNVIDPLGVADTYGTDAIRMALVTGTAPGNDPVISEDKIRGYRNFATKIWNVARFILMNKPTQINARLAKAMAERADKNADKRGFIGENLRDNPRKSALGFDDKKALADLKKIKAEMTKHLEKFEFHLAAEKIYHYIWHEFADKIIEEYKPLLRSAEAIGAPTRVAAHQTLETILAECLKMLHPFMPFITEEIYQKLQPGKMLMVEKW